MDHIEDLEKYFEYIPTDLQSEVREFLDEYYEKKDTHSADIETFGKLSDGELEDLLYLSLSSKDEKTTTLAQRISFCKNLKVLSIEIPIVDVDFITNLSELRILNLYGTRITRCKNAFDKLSKLLVFAFDENDAVLDISDEMDKMVNLLFCDLLISSGAPALLNSFPSNLSSNVISLELDGNVIHEIPSLNQYKNLVRLSLSRNNIENIPTSIGTLNNLKYFSISTNQIRFLPKEISELTNLETLYFDDNQIDIFPDEIFLLPKLKNVWFRENPYKKTPAVKMISEIMDKADVDFDNEINFFQLLKTLNKPTLRTDYNYVNLKIPKSLQTPMLQYFEFFKDYVEATKGKDIIFDIKRDKEGLVLVTNGDTAITLPQIGNYFEEYIKLTQQKSEDWIFNFEKPVTAMEADILRLKMENEIGRLKNAFQIAKLESQHLSNQLADKNAENQFLKELSQSLSSKIDILISGKTTDGLHIDQLLLDIQNIAVKMLERKYSHQLENLHNDVLTDFLRQKGYQAADQTRSGRSKLGVGELDIMIRKKDGTPFSIIEAFRLDSCGEKNNTVAEHIDKLLHDYDTAGHKRNFVIVYAEAKKFEQLWLGYKTYISELNGKPAFRAEFPLIKFEERTEISDKSSIKIGLASHRREGTFVEIYHVFINMFA